MKPRSAIFWRSRDARAGSIAPRGSLGIRRPITLRTATAGYTWSVRRAAEKLPGTWFSELVSDIHDLPGIERRYRMPKMGASAFQRADHHCPQLARGVSAAN